MFAAPIPLEFEAAGALVESAIQQVWLMLLRCHWFLLSLFPSFKALAEAHELRVAGRDVTPFILKRVNELTGGASLKSNIALVSLIDYQCFTCCSLNHEFV